MSANFEASTLAPSAERYPNFDCLRLFLAGEVFVDHARYLAHPSTNWNTFIEPVPAFLAISGFLVLKSFCNSTGPGEFFIKRALRVLPALLVSLVLCWCLFGPAMAYNSILVYATGGLYSLPQAANGPLWSLMWEELAYLALAVLWLVGFYKKPTMIAMAILAAVLLLWLNQDRDPHFRTILFLPITFLIGNLMYVYRDALAKMDRAMPFVILLVVLEWRQLPDASMMGGATLAVAQAIALILLGLVAHRIIPWRIPDVSYGVYIYHWPIVVFINAKLHLTSIPELLVASAVFVIPVTLLSWYGVERPILGLKHRIRLGSRPRPSRPRDCVDLGAQALIPNDTPDAAMRAA